MLIFSQDDIRYNIDVRYNIICDTISIYDWLPADTVAYYNCYWSPVGCMSKTPFEYIALMF